MGILVLCCWGAGIVSGKHHVSACQKDPEYLIQDSHQNETMFHHQRRLRYLASADNMLP